MDLIDMSSIMILPALGRPLHLGMLYDCHNDAMIPGVSLWDGEALGKEKRITLQNKTEFKIIASDYIEDRASALDIPESLKSSFLAGLVDVGGAAKYLKEKKASKKQARVTLMHTTTTTFEQMTMMLSKPRNSTNTRIFDQDIGTHIVMGILYGAQAFYVFERGVYSNTHKHEIQGELQRELKAAVNKMPESRPSDYGFRNRDEVVKVEPDVCKFNYYSCTFYGDYALKAKPSIYKEAMNVLKNLLSHSDSRPVPVKIWLFPLWKLNSKTPPVVHSISSVLIEEVQVVMEELSDIDMQCEDLLDEPAAIQFPDITSKIQRFRNLCNQYRLSFQKALSAALLSIRRGDGEEAALQAILTAREQSPFSTEQLTQYIESVEKEVSFVSVCLSWLTVKPAIKILSSQQEINHVLWDCKVELVVLFMFTSLREEEPYILNLKQWLKLKYMAQTADPTSSRPDLTEKKFINWLDDANIYQNIRTYVNAFIEFASGNVANHKIQFIISSLKDPDNAGASVYLYENGILKSSAFWPPQLAAPVISEVCHDGVRLTGATCPTGGDQVLGYRVEYRSAKVEAWTIVDGKNPNEAFIVTGLLPNSLYQFRQSAVLARWVTRPSDPTGMIKTLPCSPPGKAIGCHYQPNSITLKWEEPGTICAGIQITSYKIEFSEEPEDMNMWTEVMTGKKVESHTIEKLKPNSSYRFRVSAACEKAGNSAPSEESVLSTTALGKKSFDDYST